MRSNLKVLKVAHENLLEWFEMPCIGIYGGHFGITWFSFLSFEATQVKKQ